MTNVQLRPSQQAALDTFKKFLSGTNQVMILKGAAGTGKTTLARLFVEELGARAVLMAPTGRAAHIIGAKAGAPAFTIHKIIYQMSRAQTTGQNREDEDDGGLSLRFALRGNDAPMSMVYIVDEASMVADIKCETEGLIFGSGKLLTDLFTYVRGRKIVFIGDYAQLPPVGMNFSPALDSQYLKDKFGCGIVDVRLDEVMRQGGESAILANATKIRESIDAKTFTEFKILDGQDTTCERDNLLLPYFRESPDRPSFKSVVVVHSNAKALAYNQDIRRHYFGENAQRLLPGDLLMVARNHYTPTEELYNGTIVRVVACQTDEELETRTVTVKTGKGKYETVTLSFRSVAIQYNDRGEAKELSLMILDNFLNDPNREVGGLLSRALIVDFESRLPAEVKNRLTEVKRLLRSCQPMSEDQQQLVQTYISKLLSDKYYHALICKYGYALTCHKAQGGEWEKVFVDMGRMGGIANEEYFRWAYTAVTRASKGLWHFRSPDFNFTSQMAVNGEIQQSNNLKISYYAPAGEDFLVARFERIKKICDDRGLSVSEDKSWQYQHAITITNAEEQQVSISLWYNKKGYSNSEKLLKSDSEALYAECREILQASTVPANVPFTAPGRPWAEKLAENVKTLIKELDIQLLNVTQEQYQDVFHLKTNGFAKVGFFYNDRGFYTRVLMQSTLGPADDKLQQLRKLLN